MAEANQEITIGTVKWFDSTKGYGFIEIKDSNKDSNNDVFVHQSDVHAQGFRSLGEGEVVEFTVEDQQDGRKQAKNVTGPQGSYVKGAPRPTRQ